jgi:uncharacterized protein (UPF0264 family)
MKLLVSVADASEASEALQGGADFIEAKDPSRGALGAVPLQTLQAIHAVVGAARPVTAALGDADDEDAVERASSSFAAAGCAFVKVGFSGIRSVARVSRLIQSAVGGASRRCGVVAVAYADRSGGTGLAPAALVDVAAQAGAIGILLDTADKSGPGLRGLVTPPALAAWVASARQAGLLVALAGKLTADDLLLVRDAGADIAGIRGAACDGGRLGRVTAARVRSMRGTVGSGR